MSAGSRFLRQPCARVGAVWPACEGAYECQSKCTNSASCDALKGVDLEGQAEYLKCNSECQTQTLP